MEPDLSPLLVAHHVEADARVEDLCAVGRDGGAGDPLELEEVHDLERAEALGLLGDGEEGEGQQHGELGGRSVGGDQRGVTVAGGGGPGTS